MNKGKILFILPEKKKYDWQNLMDFAKREGIPIDIEHDEINGYEMLKRGEYNLVISNLFAEKLNGYELIAKIKKDNINCDVILIMDDKKAKIEKELIEKGVFSFVKKTENHEFELFRQINSYLKGKSEFSKDKQKSMEVINFELEQEMLEKVEELDLLSEKLKTVTEELEMTRARLHKKREYLVNSERMISVGQMTASIVHEINNPLTAIVSLVSAISLECKDNSKVTKYNNMLTCNIDKLRGLTNNILSFSNPLREEAVEGVDINAAIEDLLAFYGYEIKRKNMSLEVDFSENLRHVNISKVKVQQVILNILKNAVHAVSHDNGIIKIKTYAKKNNVFIEISDNGDGIPEDKIHEVFKPFFSTKSKNEGSGLGLFICKEILESFGSSIEVKSKLGKGTKIIVKLPVFKNN